MKITCNACGAKYTIADEKVQGKRVKVRCKSCKASILVDGTGGAGGEAEADDAIDETADLAKIPALSLGPVMPGTGLAGAPAGGEAPAPAGLGGDAKKPPERKPVKKNAWSVNLTDDDSREMTTEELVAGWKSGLVTRDAYVWKDGMDDWKPILDVPELKLRLKAVSPPAAAAAPVVTSAGRAPAAPAGGSADLFGGADFGSSSETTTSAQDKKAAPAGPATGARNESSVLFSLDALKAQGPSEKEERSNPNDLFAGLGGGGLGGGLGGGMLGGSTDLLTAPAKDPPPAPAGARAVPAASPSFDAPPSKGKGGLIAAVLGGVLVLGGGAFFLTQGGGDDDAAKAALAEAEAKAKAGSEAAEAEKKKLEEEKAKTEKEKRELEEKLKAAEAAAAKKDEPAPADAKKDEPAPAAGTTPAAGTKPAAGGDKPATPAAPAAPAGGGAFDTAAAKAALSTAAAGAASCAQPGGPTGSGKAEVTFAPSGRVTSANVVSGPFGGTPVGGCIASTFRKARVPAFSGAPVTVAKSFTVK